MPNKYLRSPPDDVFEGDENLPNDVDDHGARLHQSLPALGNFVSTIFRRGWKVRGSYRWPECLGCGALGWNYRSRVRHDRFHDNLEELIRFVEKLADDHDKMINKVNWMHDIFTRTDVDIENIVRREEIEQ